MSAASQFALSRLGRVQNCLTCLLLGKKNPYFPFCGIFLVDITFQAYYYFICISMTNVQTFINTIRHVISTVSNYSRFLHIPDIKSNIQLCGKDSRVVIYLNTLILTSFNQKLICHQSSLSS